MATKIRKFVFVNLVEAVKHVDLDLLKKILLRTFTYERKVEKGRKILIKLISASPGDVKTRHEAIPSEKKC